MKTFKTLTIFAICATMAACTEELVCIEDTGKAKDCHLTIQMRSSAQESSKAQSSDEAAVNTLNISVYDSNGTLEWNGSWDTSCPSEIEVSGIEAGKKTICVAANKSLSSKDSPTAFSGSGTSLEDNSENNFVMYGTNTATASKEGDHCTILLKRIAAKVVVSGTIKTAFPTELAKPSFDILQIYLGNAGGTSNLNARSATSAELINDCSGTATTSVAQLKKFTVADKSSWTDGGKFNGGVSFYCYPNSMQTKGTRVLLKALYNNKTCYYPIDINECLANHCYTLGNICITAKGADTPDGDFSKSSISFTLSVEDWTGINMGDKEF